MVDSHPWLLGAVGAVEQKPRTTAGQSVDSPVASPPGADRWDLGQLAALYLICPLECCK